MTPLSKWKTIGYAAAIFVAGAISGGALGVYEARSHLFTPTGEREIALHMRKRLQARLGLSPDQVAKIEPIIDSAASQIHSVRIETTQQINKVFDDSFARISAILTPDQRAKLEQIQKERRAMMQGRWDGRWHPGGLGGPDGPRHSPDSPPP
jgi:Spy/CpxP family protein refolding chaperone